MKRTKQTILFQGALCLCIGFACHKVETLVLAPPVVAKIAEVRGKPLEQLATAVNEEGEGGMTYPITIPRWLRWSFFAMGGVLLLESLVTEK